MSYKLFCLFLILALGVHMIMPATGFAQGMISLPIPGEMVRVSPVFDPMMIRGVMVSPDNPFELKFLMDSGDAILADEALKKEGQGLIKYFLATLTTPDEDLWVNLSPYENDRIMANEFGQTEMGRDMLAQDYLLKQLTASLMYPEEELGRRFWERVYEEAYKRFRTTNILVNTFNKVWIIPEYADVYEKDGVAYILDCRLKVMLEEDYIASQQVLGNAAWARKLGVADLTEEDKANLFASQSDPLKAILKEIIVPEIEREVNEGRNFGQLRQIFYSMILATWYKERLKNSILNHVYSNQKKINGIDVEDKDIKEKIYQQYITAFKRGVYNYIKEQYDPQKGEVIPRKYFSGGATWINIKDVTRYHKELPSNFDKVPRSDFAMLTRLDDSAQAAPRAMDAAMLDTSGRQRARQDAFEKLVRDRFEFDNVIASFNDLLKGANLKVYPSRADLYQYEGGLDTGSYFFTKLVGYGLDAQRKYIALRRLIEQDQFLDFISGEATFSRGDLLRILKNKELDDELDLILKDQDSYDDFISMLADRDYMDILFSHTGTAEIYIENNKLVAQLPNTQLVDVLGFISFSPEDRNIEFLLSENSMAQFLFDIRRQVLPLLVEAAQEYGWGFRSPLEVELSDAVRPIANVISRVREQELERFLGQDTFSRRVEDLEHGAFQNLKDLFQERKQQGQPVMIGISGLPGGGKTQKDKRVAAAIAEVVKEDIVIIDEDRFIKQRAPVDTRGEGLGGKFDWSAHDQSLKDLREGRSVMAQMYDPVTGGNPMLALTEAGNIIILNGNRTITIVADKDQNLFDLIEEEHQPGQPAQVIRHHFKTENLTQSGPFTSGSTVYQFKIENGKLMVGFQGYDVLRLEEQNAPRNILAMTQYEIDLTREDLVARIQLSGEHKHLEAQSVFPLNVVSDRMDVNAVSRAILLKEVIPTDKPIVFSGTHAYTQYKDNKFVSNDQIFDVSLYYQTPWIVRWTRDWLRSQERGKQRGEQLGNAARFYDRLNVEETISLQTKPQVVRDIKIMGVTEAIAYLLHASPEKLFVHEAYLRQLGLDLNTIREWQREYLVKPELLSLFNEFREKTEFVRTYDGHDEYSIGDFIFNVKSGQSALSQAEILHHDRLQDRLRGIWGGSTIIHLDQLGDVVVDGDKKRFGYVSVWNKGELVGERLKALAQRTDPDSLTEAQILIDQFVEQEQQLHLRGVVDKNPDIMTNRRILPMDNQMKVMVASPAAQLTIWENALSVYQSRYASRRADENIYLSPQILQSIPEAFRPYYEQKVTEQLLPSAGQTKEDAFQQFYNNVFELALHVADRSPFGDLIKFGLVRNEQAHLIVENLKNTDVEHPALFERRLNHIRFIFTRALIDQTRRDYFDYVNTSKGNPLLAWTMLFVDSYPEVYNKFNLLIKIFLNELMENAGLLQSFPSNEELWQYISARYQETYSVRGLATPGLSAYVRRSFEYFIDIARQMPLSWDLIQERPAVTGDLASDPYEFSLTSYANETQGYPDMMGVQVLDEREFGRLRTYMDQPRKAVLTDLDGTATLVDQKSGRVSESVKESHKANIQRFAELVTDGVLVVPTTNRRESKAVAYAEEIDQVIQQTPGYRYRQDSRTGGSFLLFWASGMNGMDVGQNKLLDDFQLKFNPQQQEEVVQSLLKDQVIASRATRHVEILDGKINVYYSGGTRVSRAGFLDAIRGVLDGLNTLVRQDGFAPKGEYSLLRVVDGGENVISILPQDANKARPKNYIQNRYAISEDETLILVDQPQQGRADNDLVRLSGIHVGDDIDDLPEGVISTKKAIGLVGPQAVQWLLTNTEFSSPFIEEETFRSILAKNIPPTRNVVIEKVGNLRLVRTPWRKRRVNPTTPFSAVVLPFDPGLFNFRNENIDESDIFFEGIIEGQETTLLLQKSPFAPDHFLVIPERDLERPQVLQPKDIAFGARFVRSQALPHLRLGFTSLKGGASINQLHMQAFTTIEDLSALELVPKKEEYRIQGVSVNVLETMEDYHYNGLMFHSENIEDLSVVVYRYIEILNRFDIPYTVNWTQVGVYVMPVRSSVGIQGRLGFYEHMGFVISKDVSESREQAVAKYADEMQSASLNDADFILTHQFTFSTEEIEAASLRELSSRLNEGTDRPSDAAMLGGRDDRNEERLNLEALEKINLQAYGPGGRHGLIDLEKSYNDSRVFMSYIFGLAGAGMVGLPTALMTQDIYSSATGALVGAGVAIATYVKLFPQSKYKNIEEGIQALEKARTQEEIQSARGLFIDGMAGTDSVLLHRLGLTGLETSEKLFAKMMGAEQTELVLPSDIQPIQADQIRQLEINMGLAGLADLLKIVVHEKFAYFSVVPSIPTDEQRKSLRAAISDPDVIRRLFKNVSDDSNTIERLQERVWHGIFDLLYRQDGDSIFSPEYLELYRDNEIFMEQGVLRELANDQERSQEDYLVDAVKSEIKADKQYKILVFATGSGALINNLLQQISNIGEIVEYDRSATSNETADRKRRELLPPDLYNKVRQITADVRDFKSELNGEEFDFIISTASLRLMSSEARESILEFLQEKAGLRKGGSFIYMDTREHSEIMGQAVDQMRTSGFNVSVDDKFFAGHRDAMFYIFVHQYRKNQIFRNFIDQLMSLKRKDNLYNFLYEMAGHRRIKFELLKATQTSESLRKKNFESMVNRFSDATKQMFGSVFEDARVTVQKGPSSRITIRLFEKDPDVDYLDSYDISVDTALGQVYAVTLYDGRSIGKNTLIVGRAVLQDPTVDRVILTQHVLSSKYGYDEALKELKSVLSEILPEGMLNFDESETLDRLATHAAGLTKSDMSEAINAIPVDAENYEDMIIEAFRSYSRTVYPSQERLPFRGAAKIFRENASMAMRLAGEEGYSSISGLVSLPDGFQNLALYQRLGFNPIIPEGRSDYFGQVQAALTDKSAGATLKEKAWYLSQRLEQLILLVQKDIPDQDAAMLGKINRYQLKNGATVLGPLSEDAFNQMAGEDAFFLVRDKEKGVYAQKTTPEEQGYSVVATEFSEIETIFKDAGVDMVTHILSTLWENPDREVVVLADGVGRGVELQGLVEKLKKEVEAFGLDISKIKIYGLSDMYFQDWQDADPMINFILDDRENLPDYFSRRQIDVMMSYKGISHIGQQAEYINHMRMMKPHFKYNALIVHDFYFGNLDAVESMLERNGFSVKRERLPGMTELFVLRPVDFNKDAPADVSENTNREVKTVPYQQAEFFELTPDYKLAGTYTTRKGEEFNIYFKDNDFVLMNVEGQFIGKVVFDFTEEGVAEIDLVRVSEYVQGEGYLYDLIDAISFYLGQLGAESIVVTEIYNPFLSYVLTKEYGFHPEIKEGDERKQLIIGSREPGERLPVYLSGEGAKKVFSPGSGYDVLLEKLDILDTPPDDGVVSYVFVDYVKDVNNARYQQQISSVKNRMAIDGEILEQRKNEYQTKFQRRGTDDMSEDHRDQAMLITYTEKEWQQIDQTYQILQQLAQVVDTQMEQSGMVEIFDVFRQWLNQGPRDALAQIELIEDPQEQQEAYQKLSAALSRFVHEFETTYDHVSKRWGQEIAGVNGRSFVQFDTDGKVLSYPWFDLTYDLNDKLDKLATFILGWGKLLVTDGAVAKDNFLLLVNKLESTYRIWDGYRQYLRHVADPLSIQDSQIADNQEERTQPRLGYDEFLLPYRNALLARDADQDTLEQPREEYVALVDAQGNFLRAVPRSERKNKAPDEFTQGAVIIVVDEDGNVLMQQRSEGKMEGHETFGPMDWTIGGHRSDEDADIEAAALREGNEEAGGIINFKKSNLVQIDQRPVNPDTDGRWVRSTFIYVVSATEKNNIQEQMIEGWQGNDEVDGWEWWGQDDFTTEAKTSQKWSTVIDLLRDIPDFPAMVETAVVGVTQRRRDSTVRDGAALTTYTEKEWQQIDRTYQTLQEIALSVQGKLQETGMTTLFLRIDQFLVQEDPRLMFEQLQDLPSKEAQDRVYAVINTAMQGYALNIKTMYQENISEIDAQLARIKGRSFVQFSAEGALEAYSAEELIYDIKDKIGKITTNIFSWWDMLSSDGDLPREQFLFMLDQFEYASEAFHQYRSYLGHILQPIRILDEDIVDNQEEQSHPRQSYDQFLLPYRDALIARDTAVQDAAMLGREQSDNVGGIDLNPANLNLRIKRDGDGQPLPFDAQPIDSINIEGLVPVIINVTPIINLPLLLGAAEPGEVDQVLSL